MDWFYIFDIIGVLAFATSGVMTALDNKFDIVGASVVGFVTALGGGTLRDVMIGKTPVAWMYDTNYLWVITFALVLSYVFGKRIFRLRRSLFFFDTIGIGIFTIIGLQRTLEVGLQPIIALIMGVTTAVFGGVLRDVLTNEVPLIFRREIYASACVAGGLIYMLLLRYHVNSETATLISMIWVFVIRYLSVKFDWSLKVPMRK